MTLNILLEQTGKNWTLYPNREYLVGTARDCDIFFPNNSQVSERHAKFSFDQSSNTWHIVDLGSSSGVFVNNQAVSDYPIQAQTRIAIASAINLLATPETITQYQPPTPPPRVPTPIPIPQPSYSPAPASGGYNNYQSSGLNLLSWNEFVARQISEKTTPIGRLTTWFHMITGFRNTPWIRGFGGYANTKGNNFNALDGYILPNFTESAEAVAVAIEQKLGQMRNYEETDCYTTRLTDAHIADSATQSFLGIELFAVRRSKRNNHPDYRRFCVVSYHRVRSYLLVENYGSDLFVSWVTRFEPDPDPIVMVIWLIIGVISLLVGISNPYLFFASIEPFFIWCNIYLFAPWIMSKLNILPKRSNGTFVILLLLLVTHIILFTIYSFLAIATAQNYLR